MGKRLDPLGVELRKLLDVADYLAKLLRHLGKLSVGKQKPSQERDFLDLGSRETHVLAASTGSLKGRCLTALRTAPARMHCVQTLTVLVPPDFVAILSVCRLGMNLRRVMPVILVPTPPKYLALPRVSTWLPIWGRLPHTSQTRAIADLTRFE